MDYGIIFKIQIPVEQEKKAIYIKKNVWNLSTQVPLALVLWFCDPLFLRLFYFGKKWFAFQVVRVLS